VESFEQPVFAKKQNKTNKKLTKDYNNMAGYPNCKSMIPKA